MATPMLCAIDGCSNSSYLRGYCNKHYLRIQRYGDPHFSKINRDQTGKNCSIEGCEKKSRVHGMCQMHYRRLKVHGGTSDDVLGESYRCRIKWLENHSRHDSDECLIWPFCAGDNGRGVVDFNKRRMSAPRAMCILAHGEPTSRSMQTAHSCGNGHLGCVNPKHLRWATRSENERDKIVHGTIRRGTKVNTNKLSEAEVFEIRRIGYTNGLAYLAERFDVTTAAISLILRRKNWAWL